MKTYFRLKMGMSNPTKKIDLFGRSVRLSYNYRKLKKLHPKMKPENYHEKVLKLALNGDASEAACIRLRGDVTVLAKLIGVQNAQTLLDAQVTPKPEKVKKTFFRVRWPKLRKAEPVPAMT